MTKPVDVLIIGAGASGGAVAWSLADTKMHILCLEQGDWMKPSEYPSAGRDWEARQLDDFHYSPNRRGRETDYPINEDNTPIRVANFNGVGGGTVLYAGHFPRFHPSDFRVRTLDGVAEELQATRNPRLSIWQKRRLIPRQQAGSLDHLKAHLTGLIEQSIDMQPAAPARDQG